MVDYRSLVSATLAMMSVSRECVLPCVLCSVIAARVNGIIEFLQLVTPASQAGMFI